MVKHICCLLILLLAGSVVADDKARLPYQAKLNIDGLVRTVDHVVIGRFLTSQMDGQTRIGTLEIDEVFKGDHKVGDKVELRATRMTWRRLSDEKTAVVVFFKEEGGVNPNLSEDKPLGRRAEVAKQLQAAVEAEKAQPTGQIIALGIHLSPELKRADGVFGLNWQITNFSTQSWSALVDRRVPANPDKQHRGISLLIWEVTEDPKADPATTQPTSAPATQAVSDEVGGTPAPRPKRARDPVQPKDLLYQSDRPWHGKAVMETARNGTRPDRHLPNAVARLMPGQSFTGNVSLHPEGGDKYRARINDFPDGAKSVELKPGHRYAFQVTLTDDYHFYTGNGAKIGLADPFWGNLQSRPIVVEWPK